MSGIVFGRSSLSEIAASTPEKARLITEISDEELARAMYVRGLRNHLFYVRVQDQEMLKQPISLPFTLGDVIIEVTRRLKIPKTTDETVMKKLNSPDEVMLLPGGVQVGDEMHNFHLGMLDVVKIDAAENLCIAGSFLAINKFDGATKTFVVTDPLSTLYAGLDLGLNVLFSAIEKSSNVMELRAQIAGLGAAEYGDFHSSIALSRLYFDRYVSQVKLRGINCPFIKGSACLGTLSAQARQEIGRLVDGGEKYPYKFAQTVIPAFKQVSISDMRVYKCMKDHRLVRGEDRRGISPLTNGYYFGELPGGMERRVGVALSMYIIAKMAGVSGVIRSNSSLLNSGWDLLAFNMPVAMSNCLQEYTGQETGYVRVQDISKYDFLLCLNISGQLQPAVTTVKVNFTPKPKALKSFFAAYGQCKLAVMTYGSEKLFQLFPGQIVPATSAHNGLVWVVNCVKSEFTYEDFGNRIIKANFAKTFFPFSRVTYARFDLFKDLWSSGFRLKPKNSKCGDAELRILGVDEGEFSLPGVDIDGERMRAAVREYELLNDNKMRRIEGLAKEVAIAPIVFAPLEKVVHFDPPSDAVALSKEQVAENLLKVCQDTAEVEQADFDFDL